MPPLVDEDIVEDSEPEREALRQKRRLERKKRKEARELHVQTVASVIELSDDDQSSVPPASVSIGSVIEISDDSVSAVSSHSVLVYTSLAQNSRDSAKEVSEVAPVRASPSEPPLLKKKYTLPILNDSAIFNDSLENEDGDEPGLNLARFAFTAPPTRKASSSTVTSRADSVEPILKPAATKKSLRADRFAGDFTDAQLGSLLKCVCCNISWTTRKSAAQKMKHVQSCAKKNHFTDSAVRERIRQALESTDLEDIPAKGKSKAKGQDPSVPETYFHDVVHDAGPRKRTKRIDVPGTVKTLVDTRDAILQKAEAIIGHGASSKVHLLLSEENDREIMATQHFGRSDLAERMASDDLPMQHDPLHSDSDAEPYPATQAFGPSKFGVEPASPTSPSPSIDEAFSATQPFAPSKLGSLPITSSGSSSPSSSRSSHSPIAPSLSPPSSSSNAPSPKSPLDTANRLLPLDDELPPEEGYHSDLSDACLHFYPDLNNRIENSSPSITQSTPILSAKGRSKKVTSTTLEKKSSAKDRGKGKGKDKVKKRWREDDFNTSWEEELKENIMRDTALYQRILRYEPIEFSVFERLAGAEDDRPANGIFTLKLRRFLDDQAIHFYNSAAPRGRRGKC